MERSKEWTDGKELRRKEDTWLGRDIRSCGRLIGQSSEECVILFS